jgi:phospholipid transport system transporter-binding protein
MSEGISREGACLKVRGPMTLDRARALLEAGLAQLDEPEVRIDLAEVEAVDSSALAVLFGWLREAARQGRSVRVDNLPAQLKSLADLYGVAEVLPMDSASATNTEAAAAH